jgi:ketosteroid isomerase-like protein
LESSNLAYTRAFVDAWNQRELRAFLEDVGPDFEWVPAREHPDRKSATGRDEVAAYMQDWLDTMPDLQVEAEELVERGDLVLAVLRMAGAGAGSGALTEVRIATVTTFSDGKPARTVEYLDPEEARAALAGV